MHDPPGEDGMDVQVKMEWMEYKAHEVFKVH
jgi:hypothetical protein